MTIANLTSLVSALRSETRYAGITPESLGSLLQNIVDTIADLDPTSTSQSVSSLNSAIQLLVEDVKLDNYKTYTYSSNTWKPSGSQTSNLYLHVFFKKKTISSIQVNLPTSTTSTTTPTTVEVKSDVRHIQCQTSGDTLMIDGASDLVAAGYSIYLFRFTVKANRQSRGNVKERGPKKRGWHVYTRYAVGRCVNGNQIQFRKFDHSTGGLYGTYTADPANLVGIKLMRNNGAVNKVNIGFGKRTINAYSGHRFKFGIGFAKTQSGNTFDFSTLVTNIAPFYLYVRYNNVLGKAEVCYSI